MIDALFNQPNFQISSAMLDMTTMRQEAIASNLANIEVPNYKRIDIAPQFETALEEAIKTGDPQKLGAATRPWLAVDESTTSANRDGNTVTLENELMAMNQNNLSHTLHTQMVTGALLKLRMAITGRPV